MNKTVAALLLAAGVVAMVAGLIAGVSPVSAYGEMCGSVFAPTAHSAISTADFLVKFGCEDEIAARAGLVWVLLIVGAIALVVGIIGLTRKSKARTSPAAASTGETVVR